MRCEARIEAMPGALHARCTRAAYSRRRHRHRSEGCHLLVAHPLPLPCATPGPLRDALGAALTGRVAVAATRLREQHSMAGRLALPVDGAALSASRRPSIRRGCTRSRGRAAAHWAKGHAQQRSPHNHLHVCPAILETFYKARHKNFAQTQLTQGSVRCVSGTPAVEARQGGGRVRGANGDHAVSRLLKNDDGTDGICSTRGVSGGRSQAHLSDRLISRS